MLECWLIRLLWGFNKICKSVIEIFWDEVFMVRNMIKTEEPFFCHNFGSLFQVFRLWGLHKEMWATKKQQRGSGVGVRARELGVPSSLPFSLFLLIVFFLASSFALHSTIRTPGTGYNFRRDASAPPPQVETLLFNWFSSCLTNASLRVQISYCSTQQKTGRRLFAWSKRNQGTAKRTSARELTANFHSIFWNYFFPSHSVLLGRSKGCLPFTKGLRKIR